MIITCEQCNTSFNLDEKLLKPSGSRVRCSKCKHDFMAYPPAPAGEPEPVAAETPPDAPAAGDAESAVATAPAAAAPEPEPPLPEKEPDTGTPDPADAETVAAAVPGPDAGAVDVADETDLDFSLEIDDDTSELAVEGADAAEELGLDFDLEMDAAPADETEPPDMDFGQETAAVPAPDAGADEEAEAFGLEFDLEMDEGPEADAETAETADVADETDLDFELEMDDMPVLDTEDAAPAEPEPEMAPAADAAEDDELEDLDFELDMEFELEEDEPQAVSADESTEAETEEFDLSEIETMLGIEDEPAAEPSVEAASEPAGEDEFKGEKWKREPVDAGSLDETAEIDLSDIESILDMDDEIDEAADIADEDLELSLDIDAEAVEGADELELSLEEDGAELDIAEFSDTGRETPSPASVVSAGDIELEFEVGNGEPEAEEDDEAAYFKGFAEEMEPPTDATVVEPREEAPPAVPVAAPADKAKARKKRRPPKPARRSGIVRPILVVLVLLVLGFATVVGLEFYGIKVPVAGEMIKELPYVSILLKSEAKPAGEIRTVDLDSRFIENSQHGKIFVVTGKVRNGYPEARSFIKVKGSLFASGKKLVKSETAYAGNVLSDLDLGNLELTAIRKKLKNRFGDQKSNLKVKPGGALPFMIVFSDLPSDLEEFTVEADGSFPVTQ